MIKIKHYSTTCRENTEHAVSPIIGTILLVAITVLFVAVITALLMGLSNEDDHKDVGLNAQPLKTVAGSVQLLLYGGASLDDLVQLEVIDQGSLHGDYVELWNISSGNAMVGIPYVANEVAQPLTAMDVYDTVINVKGTFSDGREVILLVQPMTFYNVVSSQDVFTLDPSQVWFGTLKQSTNNYAYSVIVSMTQHGYISSVEPESFVVYYRLKDTSEWIKLTTFSLSNFSLSGDRKSKIHWNTYTSTKDNIYFENYKTYEFQPEIVVNGNKIRGDMKEITMTEGKLVFSSVTLPTTDKNYVYVQAAAYANPKNFNVYLSYYESSDPSNILGTKTIYKSTTASTPYAGWTFSDYATRFEAGKTYVFDAYFIDHTGRKIEATTTYTP